MEDFRNECYAIQQQFLQVRGLIFQTVGITSLSQISLPYPKVTDPSKCLAIATKYHYTQVDKAGMPYINHPKAVAASFSDTNLMCVALLHDVLEDTPCTAGQLKQAGVDTRIVKAVIAITRPAGVSYQKYLEKASKNYLATWVKIADLSHNMDLSRLTVFDARVLKRCNKYLDAIKYLAHAVWGLNV